MTPAMRIPTPVTGASLDQVERQRLWDFAQRFMRSSRGQFERELAECDLVYLHYDERRTLHGILSFRIQRDDVERSRRTVLHGYWAILDPSMRRRGVPQRCLIDAFLRCKLRAPLRPVWFIFTSGTFKSYLMCARTTAIFWPNRRAPMPDEVIRLRNRVMQATEGPAYEASRGVLAGLDSVEFLEAQPSNDSHANDDPDVAAWLAWNPGFRRGDQLVVVVPLTPVNFVASVCKMLVRHWRRSVGFAHADRPKATPSR